MKFFRIDLLTLLISLFILGSCKNPDSVGLPIDQSQALQTNLIDTATIKANTILDDSISTTNIAKAPLAYFKDPIFGTTEANIAATINLPGSTTYTPPTGTLVIDSAVLVMPFADGFYGDSLTTSYKVNVYQLNEPLIVGSKGYYNNKAWSYKPTVLGTKTFFAKPKTGFYITDIVTGAPDTAKHVKSQLRISIDKTFVLTQILNATTSQLTTNSVFQNYIKGFYITLDKTRPGAGGNMFISMATDSTRLDVYYKATTVTSGVSTIDTAKASFNVGNPHAVQIKHDYTTAAAGLNTQLSNPSASYNTLYLQGLGGLRAKISFPYLKKLLAAQQVNGNDIVLNRAELVVTPVSGTGVPYIPTPRLTMYRNDIALQRQLIPDAYSGDLHFIDVRSFGGFYDQYHQVYHYVITGYIEDLMRGKLVDYGTYLAPADTTGTYSGTPTVDVSANATTGSRVVVGGDKTSAYKIKLNILYNKVSK